MRALWRSVAAAALLVGALAAGDAIAQEPAPAAGAVPAVVAAPTAGASTSGQQRLLAFALLAKGTELDLVGRNDEAAEVLKAVIARFGALTEPLIQAIVSGAEARLARKKS